MKDVFYNYITVTVCFKALIDYQSTFGFGWFLLQHFHAHRQHNMVHANKEAIIVKRNIPTSIEFSSYQGMLKAWIRRCGAPLCLNTNSIQSAVSSRGVRRWSLSRRETRAALLLKLWRVVKGNVWPWSLQLNWKFSLLSIFYAYNLLHNNNNNNYNVHLEITNAYDGRHRNKQGV